MCFSYCTVYRLSSRRSECDVVIVVACALLVLLACVVVLVGRTLTWSIFTNSVPREIGIDPMPPEHSDDTRILPWVLTLVRKRIFHQSPHRPRTVKLSNLCGYSMYRQKVPHAPHAPHCSVPSHLARAEARRLAPVTMPIQDWYTALGTEQPAAHLAAHLPFHSRLSCKYASTPISRILWTCLLYTSPSPRDRQKSRMPSSA